jgi:hypothetical protein
MIFFQVLRVKGLETNEKETTFILYDFPGGSGACTIPNASLVGSLNAQKGAFSLQNINTAALDAAGECDKSGANLIITSIDWTSNGLSLRHLEGSERGVVALPSGSRLTSRNRGTIDELSATAQVNLTGESFGVLTGTVGGLNPSINGVSSLENRTSTFWSFERTNGTPTP